MKRGDLGQLPEGTTVVGIIDGVLLSDAAVGHREILNLLRRGIRVFGSGSMGALRAAELSTLGMEGIGRIYEEYASGRIEGDDEVVLMYDPFTLVALSEPLINLRLNIEEAMREKIINSSEGDELIARLKDAYYPERSKEMLLTISSEILDNSSFRRFKEFLMERGCDYKKNDAISLLKAVKRIQ